MRLRKMLAMMLSAAVIYCALPAALFTVSALTEYTDDCYTYTVSDGKATITACSLYPEGDLVIPSTLGGYPVTAIGDNVFNIVFNLTSIKFPDTLVSIGSNVFERTSVLKSLVFPEGLRSIGDYSFKMGSIDCVTIPSSLQTVGKDFLSSQIRGKRINISSLEAWCSIDFASGALKYAADLYLNGQLIQTLAIPEGVTEIKNHCFSYSSSITRVVIPDSVTEIGEYAFAYSEGLTEVSFGSGVRDIGNYAFYKCPLLSAVALPDSLNSIGDYAFFQCEQISSLDLGNGVAHIGNYAFSECTSFKELVIPSSLKTVEPYAFYKCYFLEKLIIEDGITYLSEGMFKDCGITYVQLPETLTAINDCAFYYTPLSKIAIPKSVKTIGTDAFRRGTTELYISDLAAWCETDIDSPFFDNTSLYLNNELLTEVRIPDGVKSINKYAFANFRGIASVYIPSSVKKIGEEAFLGCKKIKSVVIGDGVKEIGESAFSGCISLENIVIPDTVELMGQSALAGCSVLKKFDLPNRLTEVSASLLSGCTSLEEVVLHRGITVIRDYGFSGTALREIRLPDGLKAINSYAFNNCANLTDIYIPDSVTTIQDYALGNTAKIHGSIFSFAQKYATNNSNTFIVTGIFTPKVKLVGTTKVLLEEIEGLEYSTDCISWRSSGAFDGFNEGESCNIYFRVSGNSLIASVSVQLNGQDEITDPDSTHLVWLKRNLLSAQEFNNYAADFNGDGSIDIRDMVRLKKMLSDL